MLIINKNSVNTIKQKLNDSSKTAEVINDITRMLEIKKALQWRCEAMSPCCGSFCSISSQINHELDILDDALAALKNGDVTRATSLLGKYAQTLEDEHVPG